LFWYVVSPIVRAPAQQPLPLPCMKRMWPTKASRVSRSFGPSLLRVSATLGHVPLQFLGGDVTPPTVLLGLDVPRADPLVQRGAALAENACRFEDIEAELIARAALDAMRKPA